MIDLQLFYDFYEEAWTAFLHMVEKYFKSSDGTYDKVSIGKFFSLVITYLFKNPFKKGKDDESTSQRLIQMFENITSSTFGGNSSNQRKSDGG
jgi:hypothetical protein